MIEQIRLAKITDIAEILKIYVPYIEETTISFEYKAPTLEEFTKRFVKISNYYPYLVYEADNKILGFAYGSPYQERAAYTYDADLSIYLANEAKGRGIGLKLYEGLLKLLQAQGFYNVYACITGNNISSIRFHKKLDFTSIGIHPQAGYKFNHWLDIIWMSKRLEQISQIPKPIQPISNFSTDKIKKFLK